uniref:uncharacterized protein LOC122587828 n=1 Tax=Erigeron canadensis TaxID=72917 RepID=UPI001CB9404E|nr:uncharacterized protein LOC122587828 [Erigeron canadensis]
MKESGCNDLNIQAKACDDFEKQYKKPFTHFKAWNTVKDQPKWQEQPLVGQPIESSNSSKKGKSSESTTLTPRSKELVFDVPLPCLNEDPAPSRKSRGKKVGSEDSSRSSVRNTLSSYTADKSSLLKEQFEVQKKKDEEYFKFREDENLNRDMKFVMYPHDYIPTRHLRNSSSTKNASYARNTVGRVVCRI